MTWTHDTGYRPAYDHTGYPVAVQDDGTEAPSSSAPTRLPMIGWRSACDCGWLRARRRAVLVGARR